MKKHYKESRRRGNSVRTIKRRKVKWIGHIWCENCLLEHVIEGKIQGRIEVREDEEDDLSSYWMTLMKREGTGD
jgi:hypothetical protein